MEAYTPQVLEDNRTPDGKHGRVLMTFALEVEPCPICGRLMMSEVDGLFPKYLRINQRAQKQAAGVVGVGLQIPGNNVLYTHACEVCSQEGRITFTCALCQQQRSSAELHDVHYGEPVCEICFATRTAKDWEAMLDQLERNHQYDYS